MKELSEVVKLFCNECLCQTRHDLLASVCQNENDNDIDGYGVSWENIYEILQCIGCGHVTYRSRFWFSEYQVDDQPETYEDKYFPPLFSHPQPKWFDDLKDDLKQVLDEVYAAFHSELNYLAAVGARTALDMMIVEKIGDVGSFKQKIDTLEREKYITSQERSLIESVTEAGNAAAHRGYSPDKKSLESVIEILEAVLYKFYIGEAKSKKLVEGAQKLKATVPQRKNPI